jgi:hypothetical protein
MREKLQTTNACCFGDTATRRCVSREKVETKSSSCEARDKQLLRQTAPLVFLNLFKALQLSYN